MGGSTLSNLLQVPQSAIDQIIGLYNQGQLEQTVSLAENLAKKYPSALILYDILGAAYIGLGNANEAIASYQKALQLKPNHTDAYNNMGMVLYEQCRFNEAIESYRKTVALEPSFADAHYNLGNALKHSGQLNKAIESYKNSLAINPNDAQVLNNYGHALKDYGEFDQAIKAFKRAIGINPDLTDAKINLDSAFEQKNDLEKTITDYARIAKLEIGSAEILNFTGTLLFNKGYTSAALDRYKTALKIKPDFAGANSNIGMVLMEKGELEAALKSFKRALKIKPTMGVALSQAYHVAALMSDWAYVKHIKKDLLSDQLDGLQSIYGLLALTDEPTVHLKNSTTEVIKKYKFIPRFEISPCQGSKRIKIGYFSSCFRRHPISIQSVQMLEYQNKEQFETFAFHYGPDTNDDYNLRIRASFDHFINVSTLTDIEIADLAFKKGIDIAIELNGVMSRGRIGILAHRPAPIQINYLAYPGTMGADFHDYLIADHTVIPENQKGNYTENIIYLPDCYMPHDNTRQISDKQISRSDCGLPDYSFVFCCFNKSFKITPNEFDIWMRLLSKVKHSVLWLYKSNKWCEHNLQIEASNRGIDPSRLIFADKLPLDEYLGRLKLADLFLDTFNFNAHTTASDSLWAGLPIITKMGKGFAARVAGSLLKSIKIPELITTSEEEYEALALSLATNPDKLAAIKNKLAENRNCTPLFNTEAYTENLEKAYKQAYQRYADSLPPSELVIS